MSEHVAEIRWVRQSDGFEYNDYNREHTWHFDGGIEVRASAAPSFLGRREFVDPEEAFVASLSSCHMLTFLAVASRKRWVVDAYEDRAIGTLEKDAAGKLAVTRVVLHPVISFHGERPSSREVKAAHDLSHRECFIARSVRTEVTVAD